ncbi:RNA polymerase II elongation factor Ell isoform X2 [Sitodiplosis mosellana]|uniref:RNA polymerase II elongation factor Ell isoform X2 n=1 Tax=Sitodiplosis mosellana TaxID=263140 RepID=UPI00244426D8|nr:RNA polymerase II elongation factor Ell isoform X2 [Sitodiplosis mosellana]XP_055316485.1 RNA polymerase II elongation factor Ell isoform X2 [Sitodiplosis mosellana]
MAALCTGISYGLSQSCLSNENKELIFVKLTDSAYRAIEEYQKNQNKLSSHATIQFLGHDGYLSFPSLSKSGGQKFSFTIAETEGLQGSFECIKQDRNELEVLGSLPQKMRIHANEDVYEATRHRMAVAEENQKNKCTREIKPNQTGIGRQVKVKVKTSIPRLSNIPTNNNATLNKRDSSSSSSSSNYIDSSSNPNSWINQLETRNAEDRNRNINSTNTINNNSIENHLTGTSITTTTASPIKNNLHHHHNNNISSHNHHQYNNHQQQNNNNHHNNNINNFQNRANSRNSSSSNSYGRGNPDIVKRPIKERLIHMLALRPYKKPEIYSKITNEGVRNSERACIGTLLKSLSFMRDNTYHLHRHLWNDVHEDWPFYTEQDRQSLKRRKPENLTPPLSSDGGSSTSGQSPTSTHNGSPPPAVKRPPLNSDKYTSSMDGPASKKQRISHYRKEIVNHQDTNIGARSKYHDLPNVTPNAQESEDSGLGSLGYSSTEAAKRMSSSSSSINSEQDHDRDIYDDDVRELRQHGPPPSMNVVSGSGGYDFSQFTRITSIEQRRQYKTEFDKDYSDYMKLHAENERVSKRFAQLEESLRNTDHKNQRYKEIQQQILKEFSRHQEKKKRFDYLHHKLSHIKRLVNEFDSTITNGQINY